MEKFFTEFFNLFPNINRIDYSTNFIKWEQNLIFFKYIDKIVDKPIQVDMQISFDGPKWISEQTRGYDPIIIENNLTQFLNALNTTHLKHLRINISLKATIPWPIFKTLCSDRQLAEEYIEYALMLESKYNDLNLNKNVTFVTSALLAGGIESPYKYTVQDGIDIANYARQFDRWGLEKKYKTEVNLPLQFFGFKSHNDSNVYNYNIGNSCCGKVTTAPSFRYDGNSVICNSAIMNDNENNLSYLKENDIDEYNRLIRSNSIAASKDENGNIDLSNDALIKRYNKFNTFHESIADFNTTVLCSLLFELAYAGQVDRSYLIDKSLIFNHVNTYFSTRMGCYYYSLIDTGSVYVHPSHYMKMIGNGLIQYYDEKCNQENSI